jgi:hypothetical protein
MRCHVASRKKDAGQLQVGDLMTSKTRNTLFQAMGWTAGTATLFLLMTAVGLALFAQTIGRANVATLLLASYVACWSVVLGLVGLVLLSAWWLVGWQERAALSRYATVAFRRRRRERPGTNGHQLSSAGRP